MKCRPKPIRVTWITFAVFITFMCLSGSWMLLFEQNYHMEFSYPPQMDLQTVVKKLKLKQTPNMQPINMPNINYQIRNKHKCGKESRQIHLLILVKSDVSNTALRTVIRVTWGKKHHSSAQTILQLFLVGMCPLEENKKSNIAWEQEEYDDLIQGEFLDSYGNLTAKTLMGLQWVVHDCTNANHILFVDDDSYVSVNNLLNFLRLHQQAQSIVNKHSVHSLGQLYVGCIRNVRPSRFRFSKRYLSLSEYPYNSLPPFIDGPYILSFQTLESLYYGSWYIPSFRFTDVYLGIVAKKLNITLTNNNYFHDCNPSRITNTHATSQIVIQRLTPRGILSRWDEQFDYENA